MLVIPALDLSEGKCVRLYQGDMARKTVYDDDPVSVARRWETAGAEWLHVVDLDAATTGELKNVRALGRIVDSVYIPVQFGGGIRSQEHLAQVFAYGVTRAIVGTAAVQDRDLLLRITGAFGERIAVSIDARHGKVANKGWTELTEIPALELAEEMQDLGVRRLIYTDIAADGTLSGPNLSATANLCRSLRIPVLAAGGIAGIEDIRNLKALVPLGLEGCIVGKALYSGALNLQDAISEAKGVTP